MDEKPYRIKVSVRNNKILSAIENGGYKSVADFCRKNKLQVNSIHNLISMRWAPVNNLGKFTPLAKVLMEVLGAAPTDLWTEEQLMLKLKTNSGERAVDTVVIQHLLSSHEEAMTLPSPEDVFFEAEKSKVINEILSNFKEKEQKVIQMHVYEDKNFAECAEEIGVSRQQAINLYNKVIKKMGSGSLCKRLIDADLN